MAGYPIGIAADAWTVFVGSRLPGAWDGSGPYIQHDAARAGPRVANMGVEALGAAAGLVAVVARHTGLKNQIYPIRSRLSGRSSNAASRYTDRSYPPRGGLLIF